MGYAWALGGLLAAVQGSPPSFTFPNGIVWRWSLLAVVGDCSGCCCLLCVRLLGCCVRLLTGVSHTHTQFISQTAVLVDWGRRAFASQRISATPPSKLQCQNNTGCY